MLMFQESRWLRHCEIVLAFWRPSVDFAVLWHVEVLLANHLFLELPKESELLAFSVFQVSALSLSLGLFTSLEWRTEHYFLIRSEFPALCEGFKELFPCNLDSSVFLVNSE